MVNMSLMPHLYKLHLDHLDHLHHLAVSDRKKISSGDELVLRLNSDELKSLDLDLSDPKCIILASCDGAAADWNQRSPNQIFPFDRIVT